MALGTEERDSELVTVVICVYNAGDFLRPAVESVLNQTYTHLEVLIVDDGSTDGCLSTIQDLHDPRIRILRQENRGKPSAMNYALSEMKGRVLRSPRRRRSKLSSANRTPTTVHA